MRAPSLRLVLVLVGWSCVFVPSVALATWPDDPTVNVPVCTTPGMKWTPTAISDGAGGAIVFWMDRRNPPGDEFDIYAQRLSANGTALWDSGGVAISTAPGSQYYPQAVSDGAAGAIITWDNSGGGIYAQRVSAGGVTLWQTNGVPICNPIGSEHTPSIVPDGAGGAIIAWDDQRAGPTGSDIRAQRVNADGVAQWQTNGVDVCTLFNDQIGATAVSDGAGGAIVTYEQVNVPSTAETHGTFYLLGQRISGDGTMQWGSTGVVFCNSSGGPYNVTSDGAGGFIAAWEDRRGTDDNIYAQRLDAVGVPRWTPNGQAVCAQGSAFSPSLITDGSNGAIVTWSDYRGEYRARAQRLDAEGAPQWALDGESVSVAQGNGTTIVSDGAGGAIIAWHLWNGTGFDIYGQRVDPAGSLLWSANGVAITTAVGDQQGSNSNRYCNIASDDAGGAIVVWHDARDTANDAVYAQQVDHMGNLGDPQFVDANPRDVTAMSLAPMRPNPTRQSAFVSFDVPRPMTVSLVVYDVGGRSVRALFRGHHEAGHSSLSWDLRDDAGHAVPAGLYFLRLEGLGQAFTRRVAVIR